MSRLLSYVRNAHLYRLTCELLVNQTRNPTSPPLSLSLSLSRPPSSPSNPHKFGRSQSKVKCFILSPSLNAWLPLPLLLLPLLLLLHLLPAPLISAPAPTARLGG